MAKRVDCRSPRGFVEPTLLAVPGQYQCHLCISWKQSPVGRIAALDWLPEVRGVVVHAQNLLGQVGLSWMEALAAAGTVAAVLPGLTAAIHVRYSLQP
jgi:hypothetical protein